MNLIWESISSASYEDKQSSDAFWIRTDKGWRDVHESDMGVHIKQSSDAFSHSYGMTK
jgi:hypothetical protein